MNLLILPCRIPRQPLGHVPAAAFALAFQCMKDTPALAAQQIYDWISRQGPSRMLATLVHAK